MRFIYRNQLAGVLAMIICIAAAPATEPSSMLDPDREFTLLDGHIHLFGPVKDPWQYFDQKGDIAKFVTSAQNSAIQVELLKADTELDAESAGAYATAVLKAIRAQREKAAVKVVMAAKAEKDSRFLVRIHEKYKIGDKTADQLHLYNPVGPRVLLLVVSTVSDNPDEVTAVEQAGEQVLASAKYNRDSAKKAR